MPAATEEYHLLVQQEHSGCLSAAETLHLIIPLDVSNTRQNQLF